MTAAWMLYALLVGSLLALAAMGAESLFRVLGIPVRTAWIAAMLLTLGLVYVAMPSTTASRRVGANASIGAVAVIPAGPIVTVETHVTATRPPPAGRDPLIRTTIAAVARLLPRAFSRALAPLWGTVTVVVLAVLFSTHFRYLQRRRGWPASEVQGFRVRIAAEEGPAVMGVVRPDIVIPRWFLQVGAADSRLALQHESEHVRARDPLVLATGWLVAALLPWNLPIWWMLARLRLAVELDCDARVLARGVDRRSYGSVLIDLSSRTPRLPMGVLGFADPPSQLERRLIAMTNRRTPTAVIRGAVLALLACVPVFVACAAELPTAADIERLDLAAAERAAARMALLEQGGANGIYTLDGVIVTRQEALAVEPSRIASVDIERASAEAPARIDIVTNANAPNQDATVTVRGVADLSQQQPLYVVDGAVYTGPLNRLDPAQVESIQILKDASATALYGARGANGVVLVRTKGSPAPSAAQPPLESPTSSRPVAMPARGVATLRQQAPAEPLYVVDGLVQATAPLNSLDPNHVESIQILKDARATALYGARGANGVVLIRTLGSAAPNTGQPADIPRSGAPVLSRAGQAQQDAEQGFGCLQVEHTAEPLYIVDGVIRPRSEVCQLPPILVSSVAILRNDRATSLYGDRGANGVVLVTTKLYAANMTTPGVTPADAGAPVYFIDGVRSTQSAARAVPMARIESVRVVAGDAARSRLPGEDVSGGIVDITTRPPPAP